MTPTTDALRIRLQAQHTRLAAADQTMRDSVGARADAAELRERARQAIAQSWMTRHAPWRGPPPPAA